jgi:hypothetical protein
VPRRIVPPPTDTPDVTDVRLVQAAAEAKVTYGRMMTFVLTGRVRGRQVGRFWFVDRTSLRDFLASADRRSA